MTLYILLLIYDGLAHCPLYDITIARIISTITSAIRTLICCSARSGAVSSRNFVHAIGGEGIGQS